MSNATEPKTPTQAYHHLASYLRRNPEAVSHTPDELAERLGVPTGLVRDVQAAVRSRQRQRRSESAFASPAYRRTARRFYGSVIRPAGLHAQRGWCASTAKPAWFIGLTTGIGAAIVLALSRLPELTPQNQVAVKLSSSGVAGPIVVATVLVLQYLCLFRHGMARYAFYAGLVNWVIGSTIAIVAMWLGLRNVNEQVNGIFLMFGMMFALFLVAALYAGIGVIIAVLGAYWQMRRADRVKGLLDRQELLERLFEIEERLRRGPTDVAPTPSLLDHPWVQAVRRRPYTSAIILGLSLGGLYVAMAAWLGSISSARPGPHPYEFVIVSTVVLLLLSWVVAQAVLGFLSRRLARAVCACGLFAALFVAPQALPVGEFGPARLASMWNMGSLLLLALTLGIAAVASLGAAVEERAKVNRRLKHNDPATLLAELLDVQYMLTPSIASVCIMVVDAARSAEMKAAPADPLVVEYSFREYQTMLQDVSERFGGTVHSTAGDGAVVAFPSCSEAFAAAKRIQTDVEDFNREINRLKQPFRLRIGLHVGHVAGELEKVQFTEVIDIAAHVQAVAPVGGIAMTEPVNEQLGGEPSVQLKEQVDGHTVMLVLNPTVDQ